MILQAWRQGLLTDPHQTLRRLQHEGLWVSDALIGMVCGSGAATKRWAGDRPGIAS